MNTNNSHNCTPIQKDRSPNKQICEYNALAFEL